MKYVCKSGETFKAFVQSDDSTGVLTDPTIVVKRLGRLYIFVSNFSLSTISLGYVVYHSGSVPSEIANVCNRAGGDEDWYVIAIGIVPGWEPPWLESIDADKDPDVYEFEGFTIYVGTH